MRRAGKVFETGRQSIVVAALLLRSEVVYTPVSSMYFHNEITLLLTADVVTRSTMLQKVDSGFLRKLNPTVTKIPLVVPV